MKRRFYAQAIIPAVSLFAATAVLAVESQAPVAGEAAAVQQNAPAKANRATEDESVTISMKVPLFSPSFSGIPVATVNEEKITIDELTEAITAMHEGMTEQQTMAKKSYKEVLNRLINIKLLVQEAENIGLDEIEDIKKKLKTYEENTLRDVLFMMKAQGVVLDQKLAEQRYLEQVKEWKVVPLRFVKEADAKAFLQGLKKGTGFGELAAQAIKDGKAQGSPEAVYVQTQGLQPQIVNAISKLKPGSVTNVISVPPGFAVVKFEEVRFPDKPKVKEEASVSVLNEQKKNVLREYKEALTKKYVKLNPKLLKQLDFEAPKPGFKNLLKDKRVLAEIKGEKPITVADLANSLKQRFFHGIEGPIREKKLNALKEEHLDIMLQKVLFLKDAKLTGVDKSSEYIARYNEYKQQLLFGQFIESIIRKEVKVSDQEIQAYYDEHSKEPEYQTPEMVRLEGLAFGKIEQAETALDKLKQGVDYKWLKTNAEGRVAEDDPKVIGFGGNLVAATTLSEGLQKVLTGAQSNEYRLWADPEGYFYVLHVLQMLPKSARPLSEVRVKISNIIYTRKLKESIDDWSGKLREVGTVKVYADFAEMQ